MASEFAGLVALVTGAGSGIGRALALELAREGARVVVTDVDAATAEAIRCAGGQATSLQLDVASRAAWEDAVARVERDWAPIDILCSNAGVNSCRLSLAEIPVDYLRWLFDVNVFSAVHGVQTLTPRMSARGRGWILFTGSMG
jgi:NAD(P)-dependent dehydrogenase (short-subunit alcohol dehydrogenase family)